jgi:hypothetical protein
MQKHLDVAPSERFVIHNDGSDPGEVM